MNIKELIKDLDPITMIEFKNYNYIENLVVGCSTKDSNSKIIHNHRKENLICPKCGCKLNKNGKTKSGVQKNIYLF